MAGLQRSSETFRRSGSSGTVWEDKCQSASGELAKSARAKEAPAARQQRSGSSRHGGYRARHVQPALDPPSPRVAACGFCSLFGKDKQPSHGGKAKGRRR
ncbi:MAPK kinase substrate protein At1g80180-like [Phragmites australis]|uniref:MAPK kinase substrate protein At1g80180-like n=1 Tax=Phragmites australis TaxID=29695 RepID=UPI002D791D43|nr:MAPK kinase substrate protein At1g80180-like [Phragmites australis]